MQANNRRMHHRKGKITHCINNFNLIKRDRSTTRNKSLQKETCDDSEDEESDSVMMSSDDTTVRGLT